MISSTVLELREFLNSQRAELLAVKPSSAPGRAWLAAHSNLIDETLRRIYHEAWNIARGAQNPESEYSDSYGIARDGNAGYEPELALLAIGGYGRGEMCPHSDIDIAFVPSEEDHPFLDAVIKEAFRLIVEVLIDGAKLDVGYAYRPVADCAHLDHTAKAALLESRLIVGSERLQRRMREELRDCWDAVEFLLDKTEERKRISEVVRYSQYAIEPNLKEGVGGLREIQTALWVAGAMRPSTDPMRDLEWRGVVTAGDCKAARDANEFFLKIRLWLHLTTGKKTDVLSANLQDRCARDLGYTGAGAQAWQRLLQDYYRHAEAALHFSHKVMSRLLEGPLRLDDHFAARHRRVRASNPYVLRNHPEKILTPFALGRKYGFEVDSELDRLIEEALPLLDRNVRVHPTLRASFMAILHDVGGVADALTDLRRRGVLQMVIPEFDALLRLAPADPSHQLTVGEHSIYAVRELADMWRRRNDDEFLFSIWDGVEDPELLVLGTLLHDVGKIHIGTDHSISGEKLSRTIGERLGLSNERLDRLGLLVRRHLLLPRAARLRDLSSPGTIRDVTEHVRDVPTLKMLYLLSLADTRAVGERSYSPLEIEAMEDLYERVLMAMTSRETMEALNDREMREQMVQRERNRLRREMRNMEFDEEVLQRLSDSLPASYVLNTPLPTVATHLKLIDQLPQEKVIIDFYQGPRDPYTEMSIVGYDDPQPGVLSKICGVVYAAGMDIHMAQVFTLCPTGENEYELSDETPEIVLDRLYVGRDGRALTSAQSARLAASLREVLLGEKSVQQVIEAAGKDVNRPIAPQRISMRNDLSDEHSVLTMVNDNVPGLLYHVTRAVALLGLDIHSAKITTWAGRAEDAFYVTRRVGVSAGETACEASTHNASSQVVRDQKIDDEEIRDLLEELRKRLMKPVG